MIYKRECGLFSNLNILQRDIAYINPDKIELILTEYYKNLNLYPFLFKQNNNILNEESLKLIRDNCKCTNKGLFEIGLDLTKINEPLNKFLNFSPAILNYYNEYKIKKDYTFVWYRGTDKIMENKLPDYEFFCNFIKSKQKGNIILKTDSKSFLEYFKEKFEFTYLEIIPISENPLHLNLSDINDLDFYNKNGIFKYQYLQKLLAITKVASESNVYIASNSNINTFVIQQRNNFDNVYVFKDEINLINYE